MGNALPKFDFSNMGVKTDKAFEDALARDRKPAREDKHFRPGRHEVQIKSSTYVGLASDPTWAKYRIVLEGTGGKTLSETLLVPLVDIMAFKAKSGNNTLFPAQKIKNFLEALGVKVSLATLGDTLKQYFGADNALAGLNIAVDVGHEGIHAKFVGKIMGKMQVVLATKEDLRIEGTPVFESDAAAYNWAQNQNPPMPTSPFVHVTAYSLSSTPNTSPSTNW